MVKQQRKDVVKARRASTNSNGAKKAKPVSKSSDGAKKVAALTAAKKLTKPKATPKKK